MTLFGFKGIIYCIAKAIIFGLSAYFNIKFKRTFFGSDAFVFQVDIKILKGIKFFGIFTNSGYVFVFICPRSKSKHFCFI
jgi:hypothetical protein